MGVPGVQVNHTARHFKDRVLRLMAEVLGRYSHFTITGSPWTYLRVERMVREIVRIFRPMPSEK